jgi:DNA-binding transcriptional ArsR family regulator
MSKEPPVLSEEETIENATLTANALKAMANPLRWRIICVLGGEELSVSEILEKIGTSQSNISQHLETLRNKHILKSRKDGNKVFYSIRNDQLLLLISNMRSVLCHTNLDD